MKPYLCQRTWIFVFCKKSICEILITVDTIKTASKKVLHKSAEATGEFKGNKIADKIGKPKPVPDKNLRNVEQIIIPPEKRKEILNELRQVL